MKNLTGRRVLIATASVAALTCIAVADWRDWIPWPDFVTYEGRRFDRFLIHGDAPWCFLGDAESDSVDCRYLSEDHCIHARYFFMEGGDPETRGLCVPNPLK